MTQENDPSRLIFLFIHPSLRRECSKAILRQMKSKNSFSVHRCSANQIALHVKKLRLELLYLPHHAAVWQEGQKVWIGVAFRVERLAICRFTVPCLFQGHPHFLIFLFSFLILLGFGYAALCFDVTTFSCFLSSRSMFTVALIGKSFVALLRLAVVGSLMGEILGVLCAAEGQATGKTIYCTAQVGLNVIDYSSLFYLPYKPISNL